MSQVFLVLELRISDSGEPYLSWDQPQAAQASGIKD